MRQPRRRWTCGNGTRSRRSPCARAFQDALNKLDARNVAGVARQALREGALPTNVVGSPETVVQQSQRCHDEVGVGVIDFAFQGSSAEDPQVGVRSLELFGKEVLPRLRDM